MYTSINPSSHQIKICALYKSEIVNIKSETETDLHPNREILVRTNISRCTKVKLKLKLQFHFWITQQF